MPDRPRFTRLVASNYRSIGTDVSVDLGPFTALVGTNGSGKSNVADTFRFVADALNDGLESAIEERHGFDAVRRVTNGRRGDVRLRYELEHPDWSGEYEIVLGGRSRGEYTLRSEEALLRYRGGEVHRFVTRQGDVVEAPAGLDRPAKDLFNLTFPKIGGDERLRPLFDRCDPVRSTRSSPTRCASRRSQASGRR